MSIIKLINDLKQNGVCLWLIGNNIKIFLPDHIGEPGTYLERIKQTKPEIINCLNLNSIFSKEDFLRTTIFKSDGDKEILSFAQQRLWFIERYEEGTSAYHLPSVFELAEKTAIDGLIYAINQIVTRHEVLRSTILMGDSDENIIQKVNAEPLTIETVTVADEAAYLQLLKADIEKPFNLSNEYPIRVKFYQLEQAGQKRFLLINIHHIATDGWSKSIFENELSAYYEAYIQNNPGFCLPSPTIQYKDYATWQRTYLSGDTLVKQLRYWKNKLSGYEPLNLPVDHPRPERPDYKGAIVSFQIGPETSKQLRALCRLYGVTLHSALLGSIHVLLSKYTGQHDIVTGSPVANRNERQTSDVIGFFVNVLVNRTLLSNDESFAGLIKQVHDEQVQAQLHQHMSFEMLVNELAAARDTSRHPIFQVLFEVTNHTNKPEEQLNYIKEMEIDDVYDVEKFDLSISLNDDQTGLAGQFSHTTALFTRSTIERMADYYIHLLEQLVWKPDMPFSKFSLLKPDAYHQLIYEWNKTGKPYPKDKTLHSLFETHAESKPADIAIVYKNEKLSNKELNEKSNQLACEIRNKFNYLNKRPLSPDTLIALFVDRGLEMMISILAVLKAGGAYVPIDPGYPPERTAYLLEDTQAALVLSQKTLKDKIQFPQERLIYIDLDESFYNENDTSKPVTISTSTDLAYVIYTSGTTGKPKGVMVEHRSVVNLLVDLQHKYQIAAQERFLLFANYIFDASVEQMWLSLISSGTLFIIDTETLLNAGCFTTYINNNGITHLHATPSFLNTIDPKGLKKLKRVIFGAELLHRKLFDRYKAAIEMVINEYGPTETTITSLIGINSHILSKPSIGNITAYVLDINRKPVPIGVSGELYLGGACLARGYLNRPELTAERFILNPFATAADKASGYTRLYKTGDMVRWLPDGNLEYIGRNDDQVKVNGYRIELAEVEQAVITVKGIEQACVLVKERTTDYNAGKYLVCYYVSKKPQEAVSPSVLQNELSAKLPAYMVPAVFVTMPSFLLTINGKLDKKALPDPVALNMEEYVAPFTEIEKEICKIWERTLGAHDVGLNDDFFKIGGNSILAIQASHRMSKLLDRDIKVADIFKYKTISLLLTHSAGIEPVIIPVIQSNEGILSFAQQRLWFIERYEEGTNAYHLPSVFELTADADIDGLMYAIEQVIARHEVLRSTITMDDSNEDAIQQVHTDPLPIEMVTIANEVDYQQSLKADIDMPFDLSSEYPIRVKFYIIGNNGLIQKRALLINIHHIATDGWSKEIFEHELAVYYNAYLNRDKAFCLPLPEIQYKDYAAWQRSFLRGEILANQLIYWKTKLYGYETLNLPTDYPRQERIDYKGAITPFEINREISEKLRLLCRQYGVTMHTTLLSSIHILLSKYTGQDDIITGSPVANRHQRQTADVIGFFVNVLVNRTLLQKNESFAALIKQVHAEQIQAQLHQDLPFEILVSELGVTRDASRHPVFQVLFELSNSGDHKTGKRLNCLKEIEVDDIYDVEKFDLSISLNDDGTVLTGHISYATALFGATTIERLADYYGHLLEQLISAPEASFHKFSLIKPETFHRLVYKWNQTDKPYPQDKTLHALFEARVKLSHNDTALVYNGEKLSYIELNEKSNQLAREIRDRLKQLNGRLLNADTFIALFVDRSLEMVISILAVLKAGAAYVPIDPGYPQERINYLLEDTQSSLILSQKKLRKKLYRPEEMIVYIDLDQHFYTENDIANLGPVNSSTDLAYVIYTSGTTGKPKGVMVEHRSVVNTIDALSPVYHKKGGIRVTAFTAYVFDVSVSEIFCGLLNGLELHILADNIRTDSAVLSVYLISNKINIAYLPPVLLSQMPLIDYPDLTTMIYAGEPCDRQTASNWSAKTDLFNYYGPTELSIYATGKRIYTNEVEQIGKAIQNIRSYVLDPDKNPVPIGVTGELYLGGAGVARGYLNQPELTAERFIPNPFATEEDKIKGNTRLYKTGDLVRMLPDGNLKYIGRNDEQVKINGYRIELTEIEYAVKAINEIEQACVLVKERNIDGIITKYLVCYYISEKEVSRVVIQNKLMELLPSYMVPAMFMRVEVFPLTVNGKLDKKSFPDPEFEASTAYVKPETILEIELCRAYGKVLGLPGEQISCYQNFFEIGGNSILSIRLKQELNKLEEFKHITIADLFKFNSINKLVLSLRKDNDPGYKLQNNTVAIKKHEIAIIGMSGSFSGAKNIPELWKLIKDQREGISFHTREECKKSGVEPHVLDDPGFISVSSPIEGIEYFDPQFWGMSAREARQLDPQYRKFMEHCWYALEAAGYVKQRGEHNIGVFAGSSDSDYLSTHILNGNPDVNAWEAINSNSKDALATKTAYFLNLSGPALSINTACSTGLVSVVEACKNLQLGTCNMALAGGVSLTMPDEKIGYIYEEGLILSRDGHCKTFDKEASGTTLGAGVGAVLLKRMEDAINDNDHIIAVIKGYATNNDGARKTGYTAPSVMGQSECIINAQRMAGIAADEIDFVECHGTATNLGDPIEIQALYGAFEFNRNREHKVKNHRTWLGAVKANIGHAGSAAGIAGLVKVCAMLENNTIPGQVNFSEPNPELHLERGNFNITTENLPWLPQLHRQRLAGISSFGIGGTNAHVVVGDYLNQNKTEILVAEPVQPGKNYIIPLSAKNAASLNQFKQALYKWLINAKANNVVYNIRDIAYTLQERKEHFDCRIAVCANNTGQLIDELKTIDHPKQIITESNNKLVFMFPGQGSQYPNMAKDLYDHEPDFKKIVDDCIKIANRYIDIDLYEIMFPASTSNQTAIDETRWTQPALFIIEYALARYLNHNGIYADTYIGHSIGEYVAATLCGVFSLEDAIRITVLRGRLMQSMPRGSMLAVNSRHDIIAPLAKAYRCEIACINSPDDIVISGNETDIELLKENLDHSSVPAMLLNVSHAFHSRLMDAAIDEFKEHIKGIKLNTPKKQFISNLTGNIADAEVATAQYWCNQLRQTVQFNKGAETLCRKYNYRVNFIEIGAGKSLGYFIKKLVNEGGHKFIKALQLLPSAKESISKVYHVKTKEDLIAKLWEYAIIQKPNDVTTFKNALFLNDMPLYQFDMQKCWIEKTALVNTRKFNAIDNIFYKRSWQRNDLNNITENIENLRNKNILVLINETSENHPKTDILLEILKKHCRKLSFAFHRQANNISPGSDIDFCSSAHIGALLNKVVLEDAIDILVYISRTTNPDDPCLDILALKNIFHWCESTGNKIPKVVSASFDNFEVTGIEQLQPRPSVIYGVTKSLPAEYFAFGVRAYHIDLSSQDNNYEQTFLPLLEEEVTTDLIVARGNYIWIPTYQQDTSFSKNAANNTLSNHPVFMVTGGLGALGFTYAKQVAKNVNSSILILLGRTSEADLSNEARLRLSELKETDNVVIYAAIDISNKKCLDNLHKILNYNNISHIDVILHAAGVAAKGVLRDKTYEDVAAVVNPKITGIENLTRLSGTVSIGQLICCSSVSSIFPSIGNMDYTAANLYMDELCHRNYPNIQRLLSINLNRISDIGMSAEFLKNAAIKDKSSDSITSSEFSDILQKLLNSSKTKSIVLSRYDVNDEHISYFNSSTDEPINNPTEDAISISETDYTEQHYKAAQIICSALGIYKISIHDDFFDLGGNSILAVWVSQRLSEVLKWNFKVADIFRLKTIDMLVSFQHPAPELIKPYNIRYNTDLEDIFFIHPGFGGAEVYQNLAEQLSQKYNCIGIDNYNIWNEEKIDSLTKIAVHYLAAIKKKYPLKDNVNLLGWSLGGLISLEIAATLEKEGYKDIKVTLLDSFIHDDQMLGFLNKEDYERIKLSEKDLMLKKYDKGYVDKVFSAYYAELAIARKSLSRKLVHTDVVLFKATQVITYNDVKDAVYKNEYIKKLDANNIETVADKVRVFNLDCQHDNILDVGGEMISKYLLSAQTSYDALLNKPYPL
ncbi:non-ribosomal peptide synthetase/type I polyketide synthase [Mucilaginibacter sp. KACC 22063]|uniref:non-ribosomal peptide synthetase/type I polyketide synthase n=1 Tax=Mucilaginibacter sp. KACC 22063 TaxID=3025666 RepID=UPI002365D2E7|nr:non-ribosomal peptide synthetase/type I polyketide synthase [Mucilaginibacter sp. KACC 22063]WDF57314.1 amino acid adenylation domain-containing protein [Mucilaginibacter sp. KACC 22063]